MQDYHREICCWFWDTHTRPSFFILILALRWIIWVTQSLPEVLPPDYQKAELRSLDTCHPYPPSVLIFIQPSNAFIYLFVSNLPNIYVFIYWFVCLFVCLYIHPFICFVCLPFVLFVLFVLFAFAIFALLHFLWLLFGTLHTSILLTCTLPGVK